MIDQFNFFKHTTAVFKGCKKPKRKPDFISLNKKSLEILGIEQPSSYYWYGTDSKGSFVIRYSGHWVNISNFTNKKVILDCKNIASCVWGLKTTNPEQMTGKAYFKNFKHL